MIDGVAPRLDSNSLKTWAGRGAAALRRAPLVPVLALALAVRIALLMTPRSYFPDEIFQYLEPAHRLVFGTGVVPWEYRYGVRNWLLPLLLAGPMALGGWLLPAGGAYLALPKLVLVLVSLAQVAAAVAIGGAVSRRHALFAGFVAAVWSEGALFATQALTEAVAVSAFLPAAALVYAPGRGGVWRLIGAGALLALAGVIRFQYAPALLLFAAIACGRDVTRWMLAALGGVSVLIASGLVDAATGHVPYGWLIENFRQNITHGRSYLWTDGPFFYPLAIAASYGIVLIPLWGVARLGARRFPALAATAVANVAVHTLIAHKEYRYILLSTALLALLGAIGTVDAADRLRARGWTLATLPVAGLCWGAASLAVTAMSFPAAAWSKQTPRLAAFAALRAQPGLCGVALAGEHWTETGGYTYLHRPVPLYIPDDDATPATAWVPAASAAFNVILAPPSARAMLPPAYRTGACFGSAAWPGAWRACLYRRPGGCDPSAARQREINRVLVRLDH